jgi:hypothetical protein
MGERCERASDYECATRQVERRHRRYALDGCGVNRTWKSTEMKRTRANPEGRSSARLQIGCGHSWRTYANHESHDFATTRATALILEADRNATPRSSSPPHLQLVKALTGTVSLPLLPCPVSALSCPSKVHHPSSNRCQFPRFAMSDSASPRCRSPLLDPANVVRRVL